jgi:hypothetical protein
MTAPLKYLMSAAAVAAALGQSFQLCGTVAQSAAAPIVSRCDMATGPALAGEWQTCCSFGPNTSDVCRTYEMAGSYCAACDLNGTGGCTALGARDTLTVSMSFTQKPGDLSCCKTCTCYGDPECVAFSGTTDLWIPCDARTSSSCSPTKSACLAQTGPDGRSCEWIRTDRADSVGWSTAINGSPCVPANLVTSPIKMQMYSQKTPAPFPVDLRLGERGVFLDLFVHSYKMNAEDCSTKSGAASWTGGGMPPGATTTTSQAGTQTSWQFLDAKTQVLMRFQCLRAISGKRGRRRAHQRTGGDGDLDCDGRRLVRLGRHRQERLDQQLARPARVLAQRAQLADGLQDPRSR